MEPIFRLVVRALGNERTSAFGKGLMDGDPLRPFGVHVLEPLLRIMKSSDEDDAIRLLAFRMAMPPAVDAGRETGLALFARAEEAFTNLKTWELRRAVDDLFRNLESACADGRPGP